jgi:SAM-dependent methyltransferase
VPGGARSSDLRKLNLGSGRRRDPQAVNLDITPDTDPDVVHDLNVVPWPFPDDRFDHVDAIDVLEHLADPLTAMLEIHRVTRPGGSVRIIVPHFSSPNAFTDPTHRSFFGFRSLDYVTGSVIHDFYARERFRMLRREIAFERGLLNKLVRRVANRYPERYERRWAWIFPAWLVAYELEVLRRPDGALRAAPADRHAPGRGRPASPPAHRP